MRSQVPDSVVQRTLEQQYDMHHGEPVIQSAAGSVFIPDTISGVVYVHVHAGL